jgi:hypothetical protein
MDFYEHREVFYFLQYQFYIRGEEHKKELKHATKLSIVRNKDVYVTLADFSEFPVFNFVRDLAESADEIHYAWKTQKTQGYPKQPRERIKRSPRGMKKAEAEGALPMLPKNVPIILFHDDMPNFPDCAEKYMMFEIARGHRKNQIASMYESLPVYDAVASGSGNKSIVKGFRREKISDLIPLRNPSLCEHIPTIVDMSFPHGPLKENLRYSAETHILKEFFATTLFSSPEKDAGMKFKNNFIMDREVDRYLLRAKILIQLAETGIFKEYPRHLK